MRKVTSVFVTSLLILANATGVACGSCEWDVACKKTQQWIHGCKTICNATGVGQGVPLVMENNRIGSGAPPNIYLRYPAGLGASIEHVIRQSFKPENGDLAVFLIGEYASRQDRLSQMGGANYADVLVERWSVFKLSSFVKDSSKISAFQDRDTTAGEVSPSGFSAWNVDLNDALRKELSTKINPTIKGTCITNKVPVCVPLAAKVSGVLMYNRSYFDAKGLNFPRTWNDLYTACLAVRDAKQTCIQVIDYPHARWEGKGPFSLVEIIIMRSLTPNDWEDFRNGDIAWTDARITASLKRVSDLIENGFIEVVSATNESHALMLASERLGVDTAMVLGSNWDLWVMGPNVSYGLFPEVLLGSDQSADVVEIYGLAIRNTSILPFPSFIDDALSLARFFFSLPMQESLSHAIPAANSVLAASVTSHWNEPLVRPGENYAFFSEWARVGTALIAGTMTADEATSTMDKARYSTILKLTPAPIISPSAGHLEIGDLVTIFSEPGATIFYTLDDTLPSVDSYLYTSPIRIMMKGSVTVKAIAIQNLMNPSAIVSAYFSVSTGHTPLIAGLVCAAGVALILVALSLFGVHWFRRWRPKVLAFRRIPPGPVFIVYSDVEGGMELWGQNKENMAFAVGQMFVVMRSVLALTGGMELKSQSDTIITVFFTMSSAVEWCHTVQRHLIDVEWDSELLRTAQCKTVSADGVFIYRGLRVCMGIHKGHLQQLYDYTTSSVNYYGEDIMHAARLCDIAKGGQILSSSVAAEECGGRLFFGEFRLYGLPGKKAVFQIPVPGILRTYDARLCLGGAKAFSQCQVCQRSCPACRKKEAATRERNHNGPMRR